MNQAEWEASVEWVGVVAGCLVKKGGKYLLVQEKRKKVYGLWNLPAGYVDKDKTIEGTAIKEVEEETGYEVRLVQEIGLFHEDLKRPIKHIFSAEIIGGELKPQPDEILDVKWLTKEEVRELKKFKKLRAEWIWDIVQQY